MVPSTGSGHRSTGSTDRGFWSAEQEALRESARAFVRAEVTPYLQEWEDAGEVPRELHAKAAKLGLLGLGVPEEHGGGRVPQVVTAYDGPRRGADDVAVLVDEGDLLLRTPRFRPARAPKRCGSDDHRPLAEMEFCRALCLGKSAY